MWANDAGKENLIMKKDDDNITLHQETKNIDKKEIIGKKSNIPFLQKKIKYIEFCKMNFEVSMSLLNVIHTTCFVIVTCYIFSFISISEKGRGL